MFSVQNMDLSNNMIFRFHRWNSYEFAYMHNFLKILDTKRVLIDQVTGIKFFDWSIQN